MSKAADSGTIGPVGTFADEFDKLRHLFCEGAKSDIVEIEEALRRLPAESDPASANEALSQIRSIAHGLSGRGGTFGYPEISQAAQSLEETAIEMLEPGRPTTSGQRDAAAARVAELALAIQGIVRPPNA